MSELMILPKAIEYDLNRSHLLSLEELRSFISRLEAELKKYPQVQVPLRHYFSKGLYGREISISKGTLLVGKIHKFHCMNVLSKGEVSVLSQDGVMKFKAPHTFVSSPGAKRVILAHEDSVWTTFHATEETDVEKIENELVTESYDELPGKKAEELCHSSL